MIPKTICTYTAILSLIRDSPILFKSMKSISERLFESTVQQHFVTYGS
jgi:hypothetical protein